MTSTPTSDQAHGNVTVQTDDQPEQTSSQDPGAAEKTQPHHQHSHSDSERVHSHHAHTHDQHDNAATTVEDATPQNHDR